MWALLWRHSAWYIAAMINMIIIWHGYSDHNKWFHGLSVGNTNRDIITRICSVVMLLVMDSIILYQLSYDKQTYAMNAIKAFTSKKKFNYVSNIILTSKNI